MNNMQPVSHSDMVDILFAQRNREYGAYQLRRSYSKNMRRALFLGFFLLGFALALPEILSAMRGLVPKDRPVSVVAAPGQPPDIIRDIPPPPPPLPTPPPPTRASQKFLPTIIDKDETVQEEHQKAIDELIDANKDISNRDQEGNDGAPPSDIDAPSELQVVEAPKVVEKTYEMFDIQKDPSFPGGQAEMYKWLYKNLDYPEMAKESGIQGQVVLSFVVGKDGSISDVSILKDIGGGCGKAAKTTVEKMPKWSPGEANGHPVKVRYTLPVKFKLE